MTGPVDDVKASLLEGLPVNMSTDERCQVEQLLNEYGDIFSKGVYDFKFLGSYKSADRDCTKEIKRRIALARQKTVVLASILSGKTEI